MRLVLQRHQCGGRSIHRVAIDPIRADRLNDMFILARQAGDDRCFPAQAGSRVRGVVHPAAIHVPGAIRGDDRILGVIAREDRVVMFITFGHQVTFTRSS